jgi:hypothetical protein
MVVRHKFIEFGKTKRQQHFGRQNDNSLAHIKEQGQFRHSY